jgi:hypothetical protein
MILMMCVAYVGGLGTAVLFWPVGWGIALLLAPIGASLSTAALALTLARLGGLRGADLGVPTQQPLGLVARRQI